MNPAKVLAKVYAADETLQRILRSPQPGDCFLQVAEGNPNLAERLEKYYTVAELRTADAAGSERYNFLLGRSRTDPDSVPAVVEELKALVREIPFLPEAEDLLGILLVELGEYSEAMEVFLPLLEEFPRHKGVRRRIAMCMLGEMICGTEVGLILDDEEKLFGTDVDLFLARARYHCVQAIALSNNLSARGDERRDRVHAISSALKQASDCLESAGALDKGCTEVHELSQCIKELKEDLKKTYDVNIDQCDEPVSPLVQEIRSKAEEAHEYFRENDYNRAYKCWSEAVALAGDEDEIERDVELKKEVASAHFNLGECLRSRGKFAEARDEYQQAVDLNIIIAMPYVFLAQYCEEEKNWEEAIQLCEEALLREIPEDCPLNIRDVHYNLSYYYDEVGNMDKAIEHAERTLEIFPADEGALFNLFVFAKKAKQLTKAKQAATKYLEIYPRGEQSQILKGWLASQAGRGHYIGVNVLRKRIGRRVSFDGERVILDDSSDMIIAEVSSEEVILRDSRGKEIKIPVYPPGICYVSLRFVP